MTDLKYLYTAAQLPADAQQELINTLAGILSSDELKAFEICLAFFDWQLHPDKCKAIKAALAQDYLKQYGPQ